MTLTAKQYNVQKKNKLNGSILQIVYPPRHITLTSFL